MMAPKRKRDDAQGAFAGLQGSRRSGRYIDTCLLMCIAKACFSVVSQLQERGSSIATLLHCHVHSAYLLDGLAGTAEAVHLAVLGFSCELVEDPGGEVAAALERNLQPWSTQQVLVDRFDARLLLDCLPPPARQEHSLCRLCHLTMLLRVQRGLPQRHMRCMHEDDMQGYHKLADVAGHCLSE